MPRPAYIAYGVLALLAALLCAILYMPGWNQAIVDLSGKVLSPVFGTISWFQEKGSTAKDSLATLDQLQKEVEKLREENARLATGSSRMESLEDENARLREAVGFRNDTHFKLLAARVVQRDLSTWRNSLIINRGWKDDTALADDQPVITARGVVGKTSGVGEYSTRVILLIDENCRISAEVEGNRARGIVRGASVWAGQKPECKITYIPKETPPTLNARVFTSGLGGSFPPGLQIGTIKTAEPLTVDRNFGLYHEATLEPAVDLDDLYEVFVITGVK